MAKQNITTKLKSKTFWMTAVPALITIGVAAGVIPTEKTETITQIITYALGVLTMAGVLIDHK